MAYIRPYTLHTALTYVYIAVALSMQQLQYCTLTYISYACVQVSIENSFIMNARITVSAIASIIHMCMHGSLVRHINFICNSFFICELSLKTQRTMPTVYESFVKTSSKLQNAKHKISSCGSTFLSIWCQRIFRRTNVICATDQAGLDICLVVLSIFIRSNTYVYRKSKENLHF